MFRFTASFRRFDLDLAKLKGDLEEELSKQFREAMRAYLLAVIKRIPVWTGTTMGTLRPLARFVDEELPIAPVASIKGRGPEVGERSAIFTFSFDGFNPRVKIDIELFYFKYNEFHNANEEYAFHLHNPGPWKSQEAGRKAFQEYLKKNLKKNLPVISSYRTNARVEVD